MFTLDKKELEVMELFWREDRPLTHADILAMMQSKAGRNTVYQHLNNLLDKNAIETGPSVRRGRTYGRTFIAKRNKAEYLANPGWHFGGWVLMIEGDKPTLSTDPQYELVITEDALNTKDGNVLLLRVVFVSEI